MPVRRCRTGGKTGYSWGNQKCYMGENAKAKALAQGKTIIVSQRRRRKKSDSTY